MMEMKWQWYSDLNPCTKLDKNLVDAARRRGSSPCGHTARTARPSSLSDDKRSEAKVACPVSRGPATASFQRERGLSRAARRERKQLELVTLSHVGKAAPPPSPMRGPTKARQICFELAKTEQRAKLSGSHRDRWREKERLKKSQEQGKRASEQSAEQRKKRSERWPALFGCYYKLSLSVMV